MADASTHATRYLVGESQVFGGAVAVDHDPPSGLETLEGGAGIQQGRVEDEDVIRFPDVLANEVLVTRFCDAGEGDHGSTATLHPVVGIRLDVVTLQEGGLSESLRGDNCPLASATVNP